MRVLLFVTIFLVGCATAKTEPSGVGTPKPQVDFSGTVDKQAVEVGEALAVSLKWTLSVKVNDRPSAPSKPPEFKDFELLSESSHVGRGFFLNDYLHRTYTHSYEISPVRAGDLVIGSAELTINGETFNTKPISIVVSPSGYENAMKINKCEKQFWSRYEIANGLQSVANQHKLTPFDIVYGDSYTTRNVNAAALLLARNNTMSYITELPDPIDKKFRQRFGGARSVNDQNPMFISYEDEARKIKNQRAVFNNSVKRDFDCYRKLK